MAIREDMCNPNLGLIANMATILVWCSSFKIYTSIYSTRTMQLTNWVMNKPSNRTTTTTTSGGCIFDDKIGGAAYVPHRVDATIVLLGCQWCSTFLTHLHVSKGEDNTHGLINCSLFLIQTYCTCALQYRFPPLYHFPSSLFPFLHLYPAQPLSLWGYPSNFSLLPLPTLTLVCTWVVIPQSCVLQGS